MIKGFECETAPLSEYEREVLLPATIRLLRGRTGPEQAITGKQIASSLGDVFNISGPRIRKVINHIRNNDIIPCLLASSNGYYVATSKEEVQDYIDSLTGRIAAQQADLDAIKRQMGYKWGTGFTQGSLFD